MDESLKKPHRDGWHSIPNPDCPLCIADAEPSPCGECGHLHWLGWPLQVYIECPLRSEGCMCEGES